MQATIWVVDQEVIRRLESRPCNHCRRYVDGVDRCAFNALPKRRLRRGTCRVRGIFCRLVEFEPDQEAPHPLQQSPIHEHSRGEACSRYDHDSGSYKDTTCTSKTT